VLLSKRVIGFITFYVALMQGNKSEWNINYCEYYILDAVPICQAGRREIYFSPHMPKNTAASRGWIALEAQTGENLGYQVSDDNIFAIS